MSQKYTPALRATGLALAAGLSAPASQAKPPAAGSDVSNVASISYLNTRLGVSETLLSNEVTTRIGEVPGITINADQTFVRAPGDNALFSFRVENTGNIPVDVTADFGNFGGDYNFARAITYIDTNNNGRVDNGDERLTPESVLQIPVGTQAVVLVDIAVPNTAIADTSAFGVMEAAIIGDAETVQAQGEVIITDAIASLEKSVDAIESTQGSELTYRLNLRNNSTGPIQPAAQFDGALLLIDGVEQNLLLVRDDIPLNTNFRRIVDAVNFDPVFHRRGDTPEVWTRTQPEDVSSIDAIGFVSAVALGPSASTDLQFSVEIADHTGGTVIINEAQFLLPDGNGGNTPVLSNLVSTQVEGEGGAITFYTSPTFQTPVSELDYDELLFAEVASAACNASPDIDQAVVTLTTTPDGDVETFIAMETAENSGIFRISDIPVGDASLVLADDGILQGERRAGIEASVECDPDIDGGVTLSPAGAVFMSSTNEPIPGARVELLNEAGIVIGETVTDAEGLYEIEPTLTGVHSIRVFPPNDLVSPSARSNFIGFGRNVLADASFAQPFMAATTNRLNVDVPVDPNFDGALKLSIIADRRDVQIGDVVQYTIDVQNTSSVAVQFTDILNDLPRGVDFIGGSVLLNGIPLADPTLNGFGQFVFPVGLITPNEKITLTYAARVLPTAGNGDKINRAIADGNLVGFGTEVFSNTDSVTIEINNDNGVFSREGVVLGKVFLDCNADGIQSGPNEPGIPGVQIHTQEGLSVITDSAGRFSLTQLDPRTHILDVRESSLPAGTHVSVSRALDAGRGGSRFVGLRAGEIRTEDFAVVGCAEEVLVNIRQRLETLNSRFETGRGADESLGAASGASGFGGSSVANAVAFDDVRSGTDTVHVQTPKSVIIDRDGEPTSPYLPAAPGQIAATENLGALLENAADTLSFVDLSDSQQLIQRTVSVRLTGPENLTLDLTVNGRAISIDRIGQRLSNGTHQALEYVALPLEAGENELVLTGRDGFGNPRASETISIIAPGEPARVQLLAPETAIADPSRTVPIRLQVVDAEGRPAAALVEATLHAVEDDFEVIDSSEQIPGLQTLIEDGVAEIDLIPADLVGTRTIRVETPFGPSEAKIRFTPAIDTDNIAVGYVEGAVGFGSSGAPSIPGLSGNDNLSPFEDAEEGVETALFLKGRLFDRTLFTFRHDSARDPDDGLFRSVQPDEFYPIYGDQSERGFDARSRGKTFAKLERDSSYVLFGDVAFAPASQALQLGTFQRTLEGAKAHFETGRLSLDLYAGETDTGQIILELPALGISGPYTLDVADVVENSETVELITRDRNQPGVIISTERLGRFSDYTLDFFSRTLIFNRPIASRDADLNPVAIRITFETDPGKGEDYWLFGGEAALAVTDWLSVGYRQLTSDGPEGTPDDQTVRAAYLAAEIGERGRLEVEVAQSIDPLDQSGLGVRIGYEQQTKHGAFGARIASTTTDFNAPGAGVSAGRDEARLFANRRLGPGTLTGEGIYTADQTSEAERFGVVARYETVLSDTLRARVGGRFVDDTNASGVTEDALTVIAGVGWSPKALGNITLDLEAEQEVTDGTQSRIALGADYVLSSKARLYAQGEYSGSRSGSFGLADTFNDDVTLRLGGEYRWTDRVNAFSEYRSNSGFFDSGVANGLTAGWSLSPSLNLRTRIEHVQPIGEQFQRNTAVGLGTTWEPENKQRILDGDIEYAAGEDGQRSWFLSASAGQRWGDITFLARNRYAQTVSAGERRERDRLRAGAAYRPQDNNRLNALVWYEYEIDDTAAFEEQRHIWSLGGEWQPGTNLRWRGRFAGQEFQFSGQGFEERSTTLLLQGGGDLDVHRRINVALNASIIGDSEFDNLVWGAGGEMNVTLVDNLVIGLGYNYTEVKEERFERLNRSGFFVRLRAKFDQNIWNIFDGLN